MVAPPHPLCTTPTPAALRRRRWAVQSATAGGHLHTVRACVLVLTAAGRRQPPASLAAAISSIAPPAASLAQARCLLPRTVPAGGPLAPPRRRRSFAVNRFPTAAVPSPAAGRRPHNAPRSQRPYAAGGWPEAPFRATTGRQHRSAAVCPSQLRSAIVAGPPPVRFSRDRPSAPSGRRTGHRSRDRSTGRQAAARFGAAAAGLRARGEVARPRSRDRSPGPAGRVRYGTTATGLRGRGAGER